MRAWWDSLDADQKRKLQVVAGLLLAIFLAWYFGGPLIARWLDLTQLESLAGRDEPSVLLDKTLVTVRMGELTHKAAGYRPDRNIFRFGPEPPPPYVPPPPPPPYVPPPPVDTGPRVPPEPQPPPLPYELIGIFGPKDRRIAVLAEGQEIQNVMVGEVLRNAFVVRDIGYQTVEFGFVGFPDDRRTRIEMGSN